MAGGTWIATTYTGVHLHPAAMYTSAVTLTFLRFLEGQGSFSRWDLSTLTFLRFLEGSP